MLVRATWRQPTALVRFADDAEVEEVVDDTGVVLPKAQVGRIRLPLVKGLAARPPAPGQPWAGDDLQTALRMVRLLGAKPYSAEIAWVDVANFGGRLSDREPAIRLRAEADNRQTDIRFGRLPMDDIFVEEPSNSVKFAWLDKFYQLHGTLAAVDWMDLRLSQLHVSTN